MGRSPKRHATCRGAVVTGPGWPGACSRSCRYPGEWPRVFWRGGCGMAGAFVPRVRGNRRLGPARGGGSGPGPCEQRRREPRGFWG